MLMNILISIKNYLNNEILIFVISVISGIIKILQEPMDSKRCNSNLKKIFEFENKRVMLTFPVFKEEYINSERHLLILYNSANLLSDLFDIANRTGVKIEVLNNNIDVSTSVGSKDEIHLGGPITNYYVRNYLSNKFEKFKLYAKSSDLINMNNGAHSCVKVIDDNQERYFTIENIMYNIDISKDYLILVKFKTYTQNKKPQKTVHLIFNFHHLEHVNVIKVFTDNHKTLYSYNHKHNYFLVVPIDKNTGQLNLDETIDYTDIFFEE
ncbi:MAG: hypothetical protein ACRDBO_01300 [Lachnospiraceae bacterium]